MTLNASVVGLGTRLPGRILCSCGTALTPGTPVRAVLVDEADGATIYTFVRDCATTTTRNT